MTKVNLEIMSKKNIKEPTVIIGFQGIGLVGMMAAKELNKQLKTEIIGHVESNKIPPLAVLQEGKINFPITISYDKKNNIIIIESAIPTTPELSYEIGHVLADYIQNKVNAKETYILEGLITSEKPDESKVFGIPTNKKMRKILKNNKIEIIDDGAILGIAGALLLCGKEKSLNCSTLMAESHAKIPDALAAASILKKLSEMLKIKIDVSSLKSKGEENEKKISNLIKHMKDFKTSEDSKVLYG